MITWLRCNFYDIPVNLYFHSCACQWLLLNAQHDIICRMQCCAVAYSHQQVQVKISQFCFELDWQFLRMLPEILLSCATFGAHPVFRNIFPGCSWINTIFIIAFCRIINIAARTLPFLHDTLLVYRVTSLKLKYCTQINKNDIYCQVSWWKNVRSCGPSEYLLTIYWSFNQNVPISLSL